MQVNIKRIDPTLPLPAYHTAGSAAFDLYARETVAIAPHGLYKIPSNVIIATPPGHVLLVFARSSLASKKGLMLGNSVGVLDSDYCGPADEILISVYNFTDQAVTVERGERIAQGIIIPIEHAEWQEANMLAEESRGGFGSTG